ncbi:MULTISPECIES: transposase domain-containing protein [Pseudomonadaceae]|uniref:Transposase domain-containing protein n=1 Tax=Pseudomonas alloputida TaxID=1940621 RepID=A0ABY3CXI2_9PSED|nr:transposase domain-containing protein [Pseudomonas aeruginosa]MBT9571937.1 transposase domain-containing protein [Pseudomonas umsongensis]MCO6692796.1 transposase domain-containing protein [Pseudomonas shirazica]TRZ57269.1 transposase domain-containing protein [Pseudomonas alloputida]MBG5781381.1 transposase domain-containing protein [Pseudomonas aeruginosa]
MRNQRPCSGHFPETRPPLGVVERRFNARVRGLEPNAWLRYVLERLPQARRVEDCEALPPWAYKPATTM